MLLHNMLHLVSFQLICITVEHCENTILTVSNFSLSIGAEKKIDNLSFMLARGERVALLGASGCGKSLLASAIIGTQISQCQLSGSLRIGHDEVIGIPPSLRLKHTRVAAVFQDSSSALNPLVTVGRQLTMALKHQHALGKIDATTQATALLHDMGFNQPAEIMQRYPMQLSGGQRQRVCITFALACKSRLLITDEPTTALDVTTQNQIVSILQRVTATPQASALLFITHDIALAAQLCQRAIIIEDGRIVESGSLMHLLRAPQHPYTRYLVNSARRASRLIPSAAPLMSVSDTRLAS